MLLRHRVHGAAVVFFWLRRRRRAKPEGDSPQKPLEQQQTDSPQKQQLQKEPQSSKSEHSWWLTWARRSKKADVEHGNLNALAAKVTFFRIASRNFEAPESFTSRLKGSLETLSTKAIMGVS